MSLLEIGGRALELGAGSGYVKALLARRARSMIALEPVADLQKVVKVERILGRVPRVRLAGSVLAMQARRRA